MSCLIHVFKPNRKVYSHPIENVEESMRHVTRLFVFILLGIVIHSFCGTKESENKSNEEELYTEAGFPKSMEPYLKLLESKKDVQNLALISHFTPVRNIAREHLKNKDMTFSDNMLRLLKSEDNKNKEVAVALLPTIGQYLQEKEPFIELCLDVVTSNTDAEYREGCYGMLMYAFEPKRITPRILAVLEKDVSVEIKKDVVKQLVYKSIKGFQYGVEPLLLEAFNTIATNPEEPEELRIEAVQSIYKVALYVPDLQGKAMMESLSRDENENIRKIALQLKEMLAQTP